MLAADVTHDESHAVLKPLDNLMAAPQTLESLLTDLTERVLLVLGTEDSNQPAIQASLDLRYRGQSYELTVPLGLPVTASTLTEATSTFHDAHQQRYGYAMSGREVEAVTLRVRGVLPGANPAFTAEPSVPPEPMDIHLQSKPVWFESHGPAMVACYNRAALRAGHRFTGPALVFQFDSTIVVAPGWQAHVDEWRNLWLERD
jgi:N-methylhydantoinase A